MPDAYTEKLRAELRRLPYDATQLWGESGMYVHASPDGEFPDWVLPACGWLRHIAIKVYGSPLAEIKAELTDDNDEQVALYGKVSQPEYPWNVQRFALLLPEPIPNVNAAHGYLLKLKASQPCTVHAVQWFHPMAR